MPGITRITRFRNKYFFLSNFYPIDFTVDGKLYKSAEHAYQAAKCLDPTDAERIRNAATPAIARSMGRRVTMKPDWDERKFTEMFMILTSKFDSPRLKLALHNTRDRDIEYVNRWHDTYWGVCVCPEHNGCGTNILGYILTAIRHLNKADFNFFS